MSIIKIKILFSIIIFLVGMFLFWYAGIDMFERNERNSLSLLMILILTIIPFNWEFKIRK